MNSSIFYSCLLSLLILASDGIGQTDTSYTLSVVEVRASNIRQLPIGSLNEQWTKEDLETLAATNIAELLSSETGVYIKNYGLGSLATPSVRGSSAGHTLVLWNGLPIHSPMLGLLDWSFLPLGATERITFQKGGNTALWGSGAIGGWIGMDSEANFDRKWSIQNQTTLGSFDYLSQQVKLGIGNEEIQSNTKYFYQKASNDFSYTIAPNIPRRRQTNARFSRQNILQDVYWKPNGEHLLSLHLWRQDNHTEIPPTTVQTRSLSNQEDWSNRAIFHWKYTRGNISWNLKTAFFDEYQDFVDDLSGTSAHNHFRTYLGELTGSWQWKKHIQFFWGTTHTHTQAWSQGYTESPTEYKSALFLSSKWQQNNWQIQVNARQAWVDEDFLPFVPALSIQYSIIPNIQLWLKGSRNYRLPTLNDRYWRPGGNPSLLPESGWSEEVGITGNFQKRQWECKATLAGFNRHIDNWILWSPQEGQTFWSAHNLTKVWSRGVEFKVSLQYHIENLTIQLEGGYDYIRSTNQIALEVHNIAKGEQLLYTPTHQGFGKLNMTWKQLDLAYRHQLVGATEGVNESIADYQLGNLRLQYALDKQQFRGLIFFNINNVWNTNYVIVERRPMPGIHYQLGINFTFNK